MGEFHREIPADGVRKVHLELWTGNLLVRSAVPGEAGSLDAGSEMEVVVEGDTLNVKRTGSIASFIGQQIFGDQRVRIALDDTVLYEKEWRKPGSGNVYVILPASVRDLHCSNGSGDITVESVRARIDLQTGRGDLRVDDTPEGAELQTGKGNIVVSQIGRVAALATGLGDVVATDLKGARVDATSGKGEIVVTGSLSGVKAHTGRGGIVCRVDEAAGNLDLQTGSGDISLEMEKRVEARVDAVTRHGRIKSNLALVKVGTSGPEGSFGQRLVGSVGAASPRVVVSLRTGHGDIKAFQVGGTKSAEPVIEMAPRTESAPTSPPAEETAPTEPDGTVLQPPVASDSTLPQSPVAPDGSSPQQLVAADDTSPQQPVDTRIEILSALSRGEISVDEAAVLLRME